jgi:hypothetical protein
MVLATFSITQGVVKDVASDNERGAFGAIASFAYVVNFFLPLTDAPRLIIVRATFPLAFGPILGTGLVHLGWKWIFRFQAICGGLCEVLVFFSCLRPLRTLLVMVPLSHLGG